MENQIKKIFYFFNKTFFQSKLKFVNIQIDFKRKFCFNFDKNKNILFMGRCVFDESSFLTCLLHEMIHIFHLQKGKNDVGPNSYHKKVFMEECVEKGIFVVKHKSRGWSILMLDFPRNVVDARFVVQPSDLCIQKRINAFIFLKKTFNWESFYDSTKPIGYQTSDLKQLYLSRDQLQSRIVAPEITQAELYTMKSSS